MKRLTYALAVLLATVVGSFVLASPASAGNTPAGCASPQFINNRAIWYGVGSSSWRIGTLTQYWGWCNGGYKRNWAHVHFREGNSAFGIKIAIQKRDGSLHGYRTVDSGRDFTSRPAATMCCSTRAWVKGNFWNGGVATLSTHTTAWT
ncbi:MAG: hypothetical protein ACRDT6_01695 [Micromonosporaceae bacterium]